MKRFLVIIGVLTLFSSCTYQDVVNYLNGKENNLSEQEKKCVENNKKGDTSLYISIERDKGGGRP